jgi:ATP-dependent DNA helicase DinG
VERLQSLIKLRWPWATLLRADRPAPAAERWLFARLPEWEEAPSGPSPRKSRSIRRMWKRAWPADRRRGRRPAGQRFAREAARMFAPAGPRQPHVVLAQAGTGTGKTLGYLAPASLWTQGSGGTVWVSTYTKALQRQLRREHAPLPSRRPAARRPAGGGAQGRENYVPAQSGRRAARRLYRAPGDPGAAGGALGRL